MVKKDLISSDSTAKNCGSDALKLRNCGVAVAEQHIFKYCGIAIAEVLLSSCGIAIAE
jgi:hypothetical protein